MDNLEWLKSVLCVDEAVAEFTVAGMYQPGYCIIPAGIPTEYLDIAGCLEETLHRIIETDDQSGVPSNAVKDETIRSVLLADKEDAGDDEEVTEIDLGYRIHGPLMTFKRLPLTAFGFEKKLYERFKLIWILEHGITLFDAFAEWRDYCDPANGFASDESSEAAFEEWENDCGFSGSLYPCFDEYLETEYQMEDMRLIFSEDEARCWELDQPESAEEKENGNERPKVHRVGNESGRVYWHDIEDAPTLDVKPVVHAHWTEDSCGYSSCSGCGFTFNWPEYKTKFCPDCGAKMEDKNETD